jgi:hypothetical protein
MMMAEGHNKKRSFLYKKLSVHEENGAKKRSVPSEARQDFWQPNNVPPFLPLLMTSFRENFNLVHTALQLTPLSLDHAPQ